LAFGVTKPRTLLLLAVSDFLEIAACQAETAGKKRRLKT
jgi:hypothetical protein